MEKCLCCKTDEFKLLVAKDDIVCYKIMEQVCGNKHRVKVD